MGWLQGTRYKNVQLQKQYLNPIHATSGYTHVENVPRTDVVVATEDKVELAKQEKAKPPLNEIEELLEATFGRRNSDNGRKAPQYGIQLLADQRVANILSTPRAFQDENLDDQELPFIPKEEVMSKRLAVGKDGLIDETGSDFLWIVVDNVVYDCSKFIEDHPGGKQVILSFVGEDCSWQFWRFHSRSEMEQYGQPLRIGRTAGVSNRFEQRPKYVGLRSSANDEW